MASPPPSPLHRRQSSTFSMSSSKRSSRRFSGTSRRSSAAFGSSHGPGGDSLALELGGGENFGESLADELGGLSDDEDEEEEFDEDGDEDDAATEAGGVVRNGGDQERDSGIDVTSSPPNDGGSGGGKHLSPDSVAKRQHRRMESSPYDGSEYGSESDLEETELISASLEARMSAIEAMARRGLEENGSEGDRVVSRVTESLRGLGGQGGMEMGVTRLSTAYTSLSTHLTNQTRILSQLTQHLTSPLNTLQPLLLSAEFIEDLLPELDSTSTSLSTLLPPARPHNSIHTLLAETADLIQDLNYLKDTLQVNQQTTTSGGRKLRAVKDLLRDTREEMSTREDSIRWIEQGCWDQRLREREVGRECHGIMQGFEQVCEGWGERLRAQAVAA